MCAIQIIIMVIIIIILISFQATVPELSDSEEDEGGIETMCVYVCVGGDSHSPTACKHGNSFVNQT